MILTTRDLSLLSHADSRISEFVTKLAALSPLPFMVLETSRSYAAQQAAFDSGHSKARPGQSPHDFTPSLAVDLAPLPINWSDTKPFQDLAHYAQEAANALGLQITWGGTFPGLVDMPHFQLSNWKAIVVASYDQSTGLLRGNNDTPMA